MNLLWLYERDGPRDPIRLSTERIWDLPRLAEEVSNALDSDAEELLKN